MRLRGGAEERGCDYSLQSQGDQDLSAAAGAEHLIFKTSTVKQDRRSYE
jgi:hypothetical protein